MKTIQKIIMAGALVLALTTNLLAQPAPIDDGSTNAPPTPEELAAQYAAQLATYSNNLASVSGWLHDGITNSDGTPAASMQGFVDAQVEAYSASAAFAYQESAHDETLNWASYNGVPTVITNDNGFGAYLVGHEDGVPNYLAAFDIAGAITINTTNAWPGGLTGLGLNGTNTTISMWDEASPRLTHAEFGGRVAEVD